MVSPMATFEIGTFFNVLRMHSNDWDHSCERNCTFLKDVNSHFELEYYRFPCRKAATGSYGHKAPIRMGSASGSLQVESSQIRSHARAQLQTPEPTWEENPPPVGANIAEFDVQSILE